MRTLTLIIFGIIALFVVMYLLSGCHERRRDAVVIVSKEYVPMHTDSGIDVTPSSIPGMGVAVGGLRFNPSSKNVPNGFRFGVRNIDRGEVYYQDRDSVGYYDVKVGDTLQTDFLGRIWRKK
jgi:hypothetical protein